MSNGQTTFVHGPHEYREWIARPVARGCLLICSRALGCGTSLEFYTRRTRAVPHPIGRQPRDQDAGRPARTAVVHPDQSRAAPHRCRQVLYRAVDQVLTLIAEETDRLGASRGGETLTVTTSAPLASMWLVPKLRRFFRLHPEVDVRSVAADQRLDLDRERLDIAIRWAPPGFERRRRGAAIRRRDFSGLLTGARARSRTPAQGSLISPIMCSWILRPSTPCAAVVRLGPVARGDEAERPETCRTLRFSHHDQVIQAAIDGSGVAIGRSPHNARHLREGLLVGAAWSGSEA